MPLYINHFSRTCYLAAVTLKCCQEAFLKTLRVSSSRIYIYLDAPLSSCHKHNTACSQKFISILIGGNLKSPSFSCHLWQTCHPSVVKSLWLENFQYFQTATRTWYFL